MDKLNCPWSSGIPHGVNLIRYTNRGDVAAVTHTLSGFGCHILGYTTGLGSQRIVGEILQDTPGLQLTVPVL